MEGYKVHDYVKTIELDDIDPSGIVFFMYASSGAMGDPGAIDLYSIQNNEVCYYYGNVCYGDLDTNELIKHLPKDLSFDEIYLDFDNDEWSIIDGGMGNVFIIKKQYYEDYMKLIENKKFKFYRAWQEYAEEFLYNIVRQTKI